MLVRIIIILLLTAPNLVAQFTIQGKIKDAQSGEVLPFVDVYFVGALFQIK